MWRLIKHDWTKLLPCEWFPYVRSFYNFDGSKKDWRTRTESEKAAFNSAWNHHQKANDHHWQYWLLTNDSDDPKHRPLVMPRAAVREMVADWAGAGRAITGTWEVCNWYALNKDKIILEETSRAWAEQLLKIFDPN